MNGGQGRGQSLILQLKGLHALIQSLSETASMLLSTSKGKPTQPKRTRPRSVMSRSASLQIKAVLIWTWKRFDGRYGGLRANWFGLHRTYLRKFCSRDLGGKFAVKHKESGLDACPASIEQHAGCRLLACTKEEESHLARDDIFGS